jgi:hypothetical protein
MARGRRRGGGDGEERDEKGLKAVVDISLGIFMQKGYQQAHMN